jgi:hypothetical protein
MRLGIETTMAGLLLQTTQQERVGFLLLAGKDLLEKGDNPRDCVFMSAPEKGELIEHELNCFLSEYRSREFQCLFFWEEEAWEANIDLGDSCWVHLRFSRVQGGTWRVQGDDESSIKGQFQLL